MSELNIGQEFSLDPVGRYYDDGDSSGEKFREKCLTPRLRALKDGEKLIIVLDDGVEAYGSSFLTEGFAGIVKYGYFTADQVIEKIQFKYTDPDFSFFKGKIIQYLNEASFNSKKYVSTKDK